MRTPIFSTDQIIEKGEALKLKLGREISPSEIHKAFGGVGKFSRVRDIWEAHVAAQDEGQDNEFPLPDETQAHISMVVGTLERSVETLVRRLIGGINERHVRHFALRERDYAQLESEYAEKVQRLEAEVAYLTERLDELDLELEANGTSDHECEQPEREERALPVADPAVARKTPNRPVRRTRLVPRKAAPSRPKPNPTPPQAPNPS